MNHVSRTVLGLCSLLAVAGVGCSTLGPKPSDQPPDDFALSLTMLGGQPGDGASEPAWYMLEPDGVLRAASGSRTANSKLPPAVRRLREADVEAVYRVCGEAGLFEQEPLGFAPAAEAPPAAREWNAMDDAPVAQNRVYVAFRGKRRSYVPVSDSAQLEPIAAKLRELAWMDR